MLKYHSQHCWVEGEEPQPRIGLSRAAVEKLGELIYIDLPEEGQALTRGRDFAEVESTKTTAEVIAPISGTVIEVNTGLDDDIDALNESPEKKGWLCRVNPSEPAELEDLLAPAEYSAGLEEE